MMDDNSSCMNNLKCSLITNQALFNHVHIISQKFDILPDTPHYGIAIDYVDLQESREQFVRELINTVVDWVYSIARQESILSRLKKDGRSNANATTELIQKAFEKFRPSTDGKLLNGQFGELLLANCLQHLFEAMPILRKMPLSTSPSHERFGSDAIHYKEINKKPVFFIGEAKSYTSNYKFNDAFESALNSILKEHKNILKEIRQYLHQDFLEPEIEHLATALVNGEIKDAEFHLVSIVAYEETNAKNGKKREEILGAIKKVVENRYRKFDNNKIDISTNPILNRITYIVFPVWKFEELIRDFSCSMPK
ncbi:MAG: DUF1837 domain-containing protein [Lachnospiraceae bacterium]|nr:DUF1837 domain-containing protein [Lachnospiraceae bacterium]